VAEWGEWEEFEGLDVLSLSCFSFLKILFLVSCV
jgi:hypothetical protein